MGMYRIGLRLPGSAGLCYLQNCKASWLRMAINGVIVRTRVTQDYWDIEWHGGEPYGWEVVDCVTTRQEARESLRDYRANQPGLYRAVKRRERIIIC